MNLALPLKRAISLWPDKEAAVDGQKRFTYKEVGQRVAALTNAIQGLGLVKGDVAAILAPNCVEYLEVYFAAASLGVVLCPLNFRLAAAEIEEILHHSECKLLISHTDFSELTAHAVERPGRLRMIAWLGPGEKPDSVIKSVRYEQFLVSQWGKPLIDCQAGGADLAQLYYTSGTTGQSKGVMLSHDNVASNALGAAAEFAMNDAEVWAHFAPMFHLVDAWAVFSVTWVGGKHVFHSHFKADEILPLMESEGVTLTALVPTMITALVNSGVVWEYSYKSLRAMLTAGSPIAPEVVKQIQEVFSCIYVQFYGMTETSPFLTVSLPKAEHLTLPRQELLEIRAKTGRPFIGVELKVVDENGSAVAQNGVQVGEIIARGPNVTSGYWKNPEATALAIKDGWIYTGDLAVVDQWGYVNIVDRKKDMIITGGENVYCTEVEYVLHEHPAVMEVAVFGVPDERWGEAVHASIMLRPGTKVTQEELTRFVHERLAHYKTPRQWEFVSEMPRTGSGKIYKKGMRDKYWKGKQRQIN